MNQREKIGKKLEVQPMSKQDIETSYKIDSKTADEILNSYGTELRFDGTYYYINRSKNQPSGHKMIYLDKDEPIGMCADTHLCSKFHDNRALHEYYDELASRGVKNVILAGDLTDGYNVYKGQLDDIMVWGEPAQRDFTVRHFPKKGGITTRCIAGNHDLSEFERGGSNIVENISKDRTDLKYDGMYFARYLLKNKSTDAKDLDDAVSLDSVHDCSRLAYAISYPAQVRQRNTPPQDRPKISLSGHRHITLFADYNNEKMFEGGCFEHSSPYMRAKGIQASMGGWITDITMENGKIKKIRPELMVF
jgi:hypothetical protein